MSNQVDRAQSLARLHAAPEILRVVNVWDVVSAKTIAALRAALRSPKLRFGSIGACVPRRRRTSANRRSTSDAGSPNASANPSTVGPSLGSDA